MSPVHRFSLRVRYGETDSMGRVHHGAFVTYFEMGRTELMRERGIVYADMQRRGRFIVIASMEVKYRAGAGYDECLVVESWVREVRGARVVFGNRVVRDGPAGETVLAEATITGALVDAAGRPQRFTDDEAAVMRGET